MYRLLSFLVLVTVLAVSAGPAFAQARATGGDVAGVVRNASGGVLAGATVTVVNQATNVTRTAISNASGRYRVPALPPGTYRITVTLDRFTTAVRYVVLELGQTVPVSVTLAAGATPEEAPAAPEPPPLHAGGTAVSTVVNQRFIDSLPTNGRNFISFSVITPGVTNDHTPQQGASGTSGLSFSGQRARSNNIMVDGLDNNDSGIGSVRALFSQEAIREFQVLTSSYSAEFGKASAGVVNIVTRSGANRYAGNAFFYLRDRALNAKNYFEKFDVRGQPVSLDKAPYNQKQWGATLGGPVQKDRMFGFFSFERNDTRDSRLVTIDPSAASLLNSLGFPVETGNVRLGVRNAEFLGKVDRQWDMNHALVVRGNFGHIERDGIDDFGGTVARSRGTRQDRTDWGIAASQTDVLTIHWLNELRTQFAHENQVIESLDPLCGGACGNSEGGGPTLEITGIASVGRHRFTPMWRVNRRVQVLDTVSYLAGGHTIKAGGEYNSTHSSHTTLPLHFGGRYIFSAIPALGITTALRALQLGVPAAYVQGYGSPDVPFTVSDFSLFAQDEWHAGRLTVTSGIRYQRKLWDDFTYNVSDVAGRTLSYPMPRDRNDVAPRLAAAYDLTGDGRTTVRGSYGMYYENPYATAAMVSQTVTGDANGVRTLVLSAPRASTAWRAPGHRLTEDQAKALLGGSYPSMDISVDPGMKTAYAHQASAGVERSIGGSFALSVNGLYVRGFNQLGTIDYNPVLPSVLGANRRPNDLPCSANPAASCLNGGIAGTSASVLQYTGFGETWYKGMTVALTKRQTRRHQFLVSYTLSKAEDTSTDFQSNFIPQNNGRGRNPDDRFGLPLGFDPDGERGPSTQDQRHRLVVSGVYLLPSNFQLSGIAIAGSGRPFTALAGTDLNGDGNGGAFPSDRARVNPADESTSVGRNRETTAAQFTVDLRLTRRFAVGKASLEAIVEAFNVFNRANFFEDTNQGSFTIFGTGAYPTSPLPTFGRYTQTLPPRQVQLAAKIGF